eukprot:Gb_32004 [translate_table: standard]
MEPNTGVTFNDVAGVDEAKQDFMEAVEFRKKSKRLIAVGACIPRGVLLVGPSGTRKTLLAKAIVGEATIPLFSISGSKFVEMFIGVGSSRVHDLFKKAKENVPCIVFVDEIDAVGRKRNRHRANLANLLNEVAILARQHGKTAIFAKEIDNSIDRIVNVDTRDDPAQKVTLIPRVQIRGRSSFILGDDLTLFSKQQLFARTMWGAQAAEEVIFGEPEQLVTCNSNLDWTSGYVQHGYFVLEYGKQVHAHATGTGFHSNVFMGNALADMYAKCKVACQVFDKMSSRDVIPWNVMIASMCPFGNSEIRATELCFQHSSLQSVLQLLEDPNSNVREAVMVRLEESDRQVGPQFCDELQQHPLRPTQLKEINVRFERIQPKINSSDGIHDLFVAVAGNKQSSPKAKPVLPEASLTAVIGDNDVTEKPVDPIKVYFEKQLVREIEKISRMLMPKENRSGKGSGSVLCRVLQAKLHLHACEDEKAMKVLSSAMFLVDTNQGLLPSPCKEQ